MREKSPVKTQKYVEKEKLLQLELTPQTKRNHNNEPLEI
jgi:hypothetical protein